MLCGAAASGHFEWTPENVAKSVLCMCMSGPLLTGYTQTINDWYDREIDAINEPYRPIPSGAGGRGGQGMGPLPRDSQRVPMAAIGGGRAGLGRPSEALCVLARPRAAAGASCLSSVDRLAC